MYFFIEVTDTFGGDANYSWVTYHVIKGNTERGAINRFSRLSGMHWHRTMDTGSMKRYDSESGATCYFIEPIYPENWDESLKFHTLNTDDRECS